MRYLLAIILFFMNSLAMSTSDVLISYKNSIEGNEQLSHKFRMASYLLTQSPLTKRGLDSGDKTVNELLVRAKENYNLVKRKIDETKWIEANAIIDSVLRDLATSAQLLNVSNVKVSNYKDELRRIEAFVLPEWKNLSSDDKVFLEVNLKKIDKLLVSAKNDFDVGNYDNAVDHLKKAYKIKVLLIKRLEHEKTIIYDLIFDSQEEEYRYMVNRTRHFLELVQIVFDKKDINVKTKKLIDSYVFQCGQSLNKAKQLQAEGKHLIAVDVLTESINQLSTALKILGIKI